MRSSDDAMEISKRVFGQIEGKDVYAYLLAVVN